MNTGSSMAMYQLEIDDELWEDWKLTVPRSYDRLGDRIEELVRADLTCQDEHGRGALELLAEEGHVDLDEP